MEKNDTSCTANEWYRAAIRHERETERNRALPMNSIVQSRKLYDMKEKRREMNAVSIKCSIAKEYIDPGCAFTRTFLKYLCVNTLATKG